MFKNNNLIHKIINSLLNILIFICIIVLLFSIYIGIQTKILGNKYTNFFGYSVFEVQTGSMANAINAGDWIIVKLTKDVKLKDIITYESDSEYITHRIISIYNDTYVTQGDANRKKDQEITKDKIVGKVVKVLGKIGIIRATLFNPAVLITLLITLGLLNMMQKQNKIDDNKEILKTNNKNIKKKKIRQTIIKKDDGNLDKINYRVIPAKLSENEQDVIDKINQDEIKEDNLELEKSKEEVSNNDDLDKTMLYRVIPVDLTDKENTLLELAKYEMNKPEEEDISVQSSVEPVEEVNNSLTDISLKMLDEKRTFKRGKNFIDSVILIKKEEILEVIKTIIPDTKNYVRKATVRNKLISTYIDAKYYNYFGAMDIEYRHKDSISKIEQAIKYSSKELLSNYDGNNNNSYNETVDVYQKSLILIANLEYASDSIKDLNAKKEFYKKELQKYSKNWNKDEVQKIVETIILIQGKYLEHLNKFLSNLETNMFNLKFNKFQFNKKVYGLELEHNVSFSKVYSHYIIDKTYSEGVVAEDKLAVIFSLLSIRLIKDMILSDSNRNYILYIPASLYKKEKKFEKLLRMIDNRYAKDNVYFLITLKELLKNIQIVKKLKKNGYKFALFLNEKVQKKNNKYLYIFDYIFSNKEIKPVSSIEDDLNNKIIYEDIILKIGDFEGDK